MSQVAAAVPSRLAEAIADDLEAVARLWPRELVRRDPGAQPPDGSTARAVVVAVAAALDDDLAPLAAACGVDARAEETAAVVGRLDGALRWVDAVRRSAERRARVAAVASPEEVTAAFSDLGRLLAVHAAATAAARAQASDARARSSSSSIAITLHELRRPLTVLSSYSQLLAAGTLGEVSERGQGAVEAMVAASEVMGRLVEALGALARLEDPDEPARHVEIDLGSVVSTAVDEATTEAALAEVGVEVDLEPMLRVVGDRERLTLAVTNLLSNAVKHAPRQSIVAVSTRRSGADALVVVRDHGAGFGDSAPALLFEKYYRASEERERGIPGTGLGLYIVTTVMDRHGGRARARAADGGGAEFELSLPAC